MWRSHQYWFLELQEWKIVSPVLDEIAFGKNINQSESDEKPHFKWKSVSENLGITLPGQATERSGPTINLTKNWKRKQISRPLLGVDPNPNPGGAGSGKQSFSDPKRPT